LTRTIMWLAVADTARGENAYKPIMHIMSVYERMTGMFGAVP